MTGIILILAVSVDVFRALFVSDGRDTAARSLARLLWRGLRTVAVYQPRLLSLVGPAAFATTAVGWFVVAAIGWALVYLPHMPAGFSFDPELSTPHGSFLHALYFSFGTITTLGYGDIVPTGGWLLVLAPLEALFGLALLLGVFLWYRSGAHALSRRRSFAKKITVLHEAEARAGVDLRYMEPEAAARLLDELAARLGAIRSDLLQLPHTYYFVDGDERASLPATLPYLEWLMEEAEREECDPEVRLYTATLRGELDDLSMTLAARFLNVAPFRTRRVLEDYSRDHLREWPTNGGPPDDPSGR